MNPEIEKLIEMALADGQISDKEREIILRKAEKIGLDIDEVEMYLEGKISQIKKNGFSWDKYKNPKDLISNNNDFNENTKALDSYVEKNEILEWLNIIDSLNKRYDELLDVNVTSNYFKDWIKSDFKNSLEEDSNLKEFLLNVVNSPKTVENHYKELISSVLKNEVIYGYYLVNSPFFLKNPNKWNGGVDSLSFNLSYIPQNYYSYIVTNENFYTFCRKYENVKKKHFFGSVDEYVPRYEMKIKLRLEDIKDPMDYINNDLDKNNPVIAFRNIFGKFYEDKLSMQYEIKKINAKISFDKFNEFIKNINIENDKIEILLKINQFLKREIDTFNNYLNNIDDSNKIHFGSISISKKLIAKESKVGTTDKFQISSYLKSIINYIENNLIFLSNIILCRDILMNLYLEKNYIKSKEILILLEDSGVFLSKFERETLINLETINTSLGKINKTISDGFNELIDSTERINETIVNSNFSIKELGDKLDGIGILNLISTYQLYKINKQTKS